MAGIDFIHQNGTDYEIVPEIAPLFKTTKAYYTGDHVIYEAGWYTFKADKSAGAWDATKVDGPFKVSDKLSDLKSGLSGMPDLKTPLENVADLDITDLSGNVLVRFADGGIKTKTFNSVDVIKSINGKLDSKVNSADSGKVLTVGSDGNIEPKEQSASIELDATLSVPGKAAEAKSVGDAIKEIESSRSGTAIRTSNIDSDLDVADSNGNVLVRFKNGGIETAKTKGFRYILFSDGKTGTNSAITLAINHQFKKGDRVVLHVERDNYPYNVPSNPGVAVSYYEDERVIVENARIDCGYIEHVIEEDTESISAVYAAGAISSGVSAIFQVFLLGDLPIVPTIVTVKTDGTGDFDSIRSAIDFIGFKANDLVNPYEIHVYPGTYDVLSDYTSEEIAATTYPYNDLSFVGAKLWNGVSLIGIGNPSEIILTGALNTADYSSSIRGQISVINKQGSGSIENVTIVARNMRYCVHDDFGSQQIKRIKRLVRNCIFRGYNIAYDPCTTYGGGMPIGGMDAEFVNCDFGENGGLHLNTDMTTNVCVHLINCRGRGFRIGDNIVNANGLTCEYIFDGCNFQWLSHTVVDSVPHIIIRGTSNQDMMISAPTTVFYNFNDMAVIPLYRLSVDVGDVVERLSSSIHGIHYRLSSSADSACGIVVFKDSNDAYVQLAGYVRTDRVGLSSFSIGDYVGVASGRTIIVNTEDLAIGKIKYIDTDGNGYIKLNWR